MKSIQTTIIGQGARFAEVSHSDGVEELQEYGDLPFHRRIHLPFIEIWADTVDATTEAVSRTVDSVRLICSGTEVTAGSNSWQKRCDDISEHPRCSRFPASVVDILEELKRDAGIPRSIPLFPAFVLLFPLPAGGVVASSMVMPPPTQVLHFGVMFMSFAIANNFLTRHHGLSKRHLLGTGALVAALNGGLHTALACDVPAVLAQHLPIAHNLMFVHGAAQLVISPLIVRNLAILMGSSTADAAPALLCTALSACAYTASSLMSVPIPAMALTAGGVGSMALALHLLQRCHNDTRERLGAANHRRAATAVDLLIVTSVATAVANAVTVGWPAGWPAMPPQTLQAVWLFTDVFQNLGTTHLMLSQADALEQAELRRDQS